MRDPLCRTEVIALPPKVDCNLAIADEEALVPVAK